MTSYTKVIVSTVAMLSGLLLLLVFYSLHAPDIANKYVDAVPYILFLVAFSYVGINGVLNIRDLLMQDLDKIEQEYRKKHNI